MSPLSALLVCVKGIDAVTLMVTPLGLVAMAAAAACWPMARVGARAVSERLRAD
jgi:hypothetical protein